ncbi:MAG: hypothetical protein ACE14M_07235 [Terriglobales bacterium]
MTGRHWFFLFMVAAAVILGGAWWALTADSGEVEFERAKEALKSVKSWKYSEIPPEDSKFFQQGTWEVDCAVGWHGTVHQVNPYNEENPDRTVEYSHRGGTTYMRYGDQGWLPAEMDYSMMAPQDPSGACASLAQGKPHYPFPDFASLVNSSVITSKGLKKVNGVRCREWKVQVVKIMQRHDINICLGWRDHLPYEISSGFGPRLVFSDFNKPVQIEDPR